ncbi:nuclear transport factor 2 family protein [Saccharomonospora viridis]|jgi:ketosteroid isomerase-like protein|uniref:SnoaL-like domain-containing protein n=1 Tax=Saccharomonospora viridis TaxID=1852 RepID=A0A837D5I6_9PSEU|nr:nuclear transport factor 2 family protein [Saccharomonospora viridis]KHF43089.1 hypothetical protein MINT15_32910 [Saccharomonospora viridis]SFO84921.1 Ketosteroid isomerase-related protein [Saccharomonospora viridis]
MSVELREANKQLVRDYIEGINRWDFDAMREMLADDFVFEQPFAAPGMQKRYEGPDALLNFQRRVSKMIITENLHDVWLDTLYSDPGEVIATYKSDMEMADKSLRYANDYICRFTVRDGKLTRFLEYYDTGRLITGFGGTIDAPEIR